MNTPPSLSCLPSSAPCQQHSAGRRKRKEVQVLQEDEELRKLRGVAATFPKPFEHLDGRTRFKCSLHASLSDSSFEKLVQPRLEVMSEVVSAVHRVGKLDLDEASFRFQNFERACVPSAQLLQKCLVEIWCWQAHHWGIIDDVRTDVVGHDAQPKTTPLWLFEFKFEGNVAHNRIYALVRKLRKTFGTAMDVCTVRQFLSWRKALETVTVHSFAEREEGWSPQDLAVAGAGTNAPSLPPPTTAPPPVFIHTPLAKQTPQALSFTRRRLIFLRFCADTRHASAVEFFGPLLRSRPAQKFLEFAGSKTLNVFVAGDGMGVTQDAERDIVAFMAVLREFAFRTSPLAQTVLPLGEAKEGPVSLPLHFRAITGGEMQREMRWL